MSTDLEKYLNRRRKDLDVELPDDQLIWEGVRKELQIAGARPGRKKLWIRIRNLAAVAIILVSVGYMTIDMIMDHGSASEISLADIDSELGDREIEYMNLVNYKQEEVGMFNYVDNVIISELLEEIQKLDTIYEQTMKDLSELGYNEQVIQTIFDTYEKKIYLLELIILENNKTRIHENDENLYL